MGVGMDLDDLLFSFSFFLSAFIDATFAHEALILKPFFIWAWRITLYSTTFNLGNLEGKEIIPTLQLLLHNVIFLSNR